MLESKTIINLIYYHKAINKLPVSGVYDIRVLLIKSYIINLVYYYSDSTNKLHYY